jgi:hypothetical protein
MTDQPTTIYTLSCPITGSVKYIGKTIKPLISRLSEHIYDSNRHRNKRSNWIKSLTNNNLLPVIEPLETVYNNWAEAEMYWIAQFKAWGFDLKNMTAGGEGTLGRKLSADAIRKMSEKNKGRIVTKETIEKAKATRFKNNSYISTPQCRQKQSVALRGKPKSKEHNLKVSLANKGRKCSDEFKNKCRNRMKGKRQEAILVPVTQLTKEGDFVANYDCVVNAMRATGILNTAIRNCLTGRSKSAGGYKWTYQNKSAH